MTDNVLYKNAFVDKLVRNNNDVITLIMELEFKHPSLNSMKHYQRYFELGIKGVLFLVGKIIKNMINKYVTALFSERGYLCVRLH